MDARVRAVCANYFNALARMGRALPGTEVYEAADVLLVAGSEDCPVGSFASRCRTEAGLARGMRFFRERGGPFSWVVTPTDRPADLGRRLITFGLQQASCLLGMYLDRSPCRFRVPAGVACHEAGPATPEQWRMALEKLHGQAFDLPARGNTLLMASIWGQVDGPPSARRGRLYFATVHDMPAAICYAVPAGETVGIYSVATAPAYRRHGIAGALVARAAEDGLAAGAGGAVLHSVSGAERVYARLGFTPVCQLEILGAPAGLP